MAATWLLILGLAPQGGARELAEKLRSERVEEREGAVQQLKGLGEAARAALEGIACDVPKRAWWGWSDWLLWDTRGCSDSYVGRLEAAGALEAAEALCGSLYSFILDDDRLRAVRNDEALAFWREWWLAERK